MNIQDIASNLVYADGYWRSTQTDTISYTKNGHKLIVHAEENSFWFEHRLRILLELLKTYGIREILDIGGGNGQLSASFKQNGIESILLEPMEDGVLHGKAKGLDKIIHGSFLSMDINPTSVANAGLFDVLEHIEKDGDFLDAIFKALRPGGRLMITVPAYQFLYSYFDKRVGHYRRYSLRNLAEKLAQSGFKIERKTYLFFMLPFFIFLFRKVLGKFTKKNKEQQFGHVSKTRSSGRIISTILGIETILIKRNLSIPFGSTCLIVACKK